MKLISINTEILQAEFFSPHSPVIPTIFGHNICTEYNELTVKEPVDEGIKVNLHHKLRLPQV